MNAKTVSALLIATFVGSFFPLNQEAQAASPEEQCFTELVKAAKNVSAFAGVDFGAVQKISGRNNTLKSEPFSVETHADFLDIFSEKVPYSATDLENYPDDMNRVPNSQKFQPKVHKANRNNTASIIFNNGQKTNINHWVSKSGNSIANDIKDYFTGRKSAGWMDSKNHRQKINGYYLDSRYVTFGRESDLDFSYPSRAANPGNDGYFPTGRPVMDMREFVLYTHHLKSSLGGDFLSCEIVRIVPQAPFKLRDYDFDGESVGWENYGGTRMSQSDVTTQVVGPGNNFRKANINYSINTRDDPSKRLLRFHGLSINYNNRDDFLNTFRTVKMFEDAMRDAKNSTQTFLEMRRAYYDRIRASGLAIGLNTSVYNSGDPIAEIASGHFCGLAFSHQDGAQGLKSACKGRDPRTSCPNGFERRTWADLSGIGAGRWSSCFSTDPIAADASGNNEGFMCGMRMQNDPNRVVLCNGVDPRNAVPSPVGNGSSCPIGYRVATFANMGPGYQGQWTTCFKVSNSNGSLDVTGTMCGLKMAHHSSAVVTCEGQDPQASCPEGYSSTQWSNIDPNWGRWHSCIRN